MQKDDFKPHTQYVLSLRDASGKARPAHLYVYRLHDNFMIARMKEKGGVLRKIAYGDVQKIVHAVPVPAAERLTVPDELLAERVWRERDEMAHYATSPARGK